MTYVRGTQSFPSSTINGEEWPGMTIIETAVDPVSVTGGAFNYTVDDSPAVALDPPTATPWLCYLRVRETTPGDGSAFLYYRTDGTSPTTSVSFGFLRHGDFLPVRMTTFTNFKMIASASAVFEVYAEWLAPSTP